MFYNVVLMNKKGALKLPESIEKEGQQVFDGEHLGVIHSVRMQNYPKINISYDLIHSGKVCVSGCKNCKFFGKYRVRAL